MLFRSKAIMAIISALALILFYISIRFEFKFALGAIAALVHDILVTLGVFSILGYEISLSIVAAFLTIVGYSLNDTIVIFDRIRENVKKRQRDRKSTRLNSSHKPISYAVFCLKKKTSRCRSIDLTSLRSEHTR